MAKWESRCKNSNSFRAVSLGFGRTRWEFDDGSTEEGFPPLLPLWLTRSRLLSLLPPPSTMTLIKGRMGERP